MSTGVQQKPVEEMTDEERWRYLAEKYEGDLVGEIAEVWLNSIQGGE